MHLTPGHTLHGLIDASGPGGWNDGHGERWRLVFYLLAWRSDKAVSRGALRCEMAVTKVDLDRYMALLQPYSVVAADVSEMTAEGVAMLDAVANFDGADEEFAAIKAAALRTIHLDTPHMGTLVFDRRLEGYIGDADWCGRQTGFVLHCADPDAPHAVLAHASKLYLAAGDWDERAKAFAADRLVSLKNDSWLDADEAAMTRDGFIARLTLQSIAIDEAGALTFSYDDGDLFWGHAIRVGGYIGDGWQTAGI
jgi:hypothetical protein